jgi:hypothetical protein
MVACCPPDVVTKFSLLSHAERLIPASQWNSVTRYAYPQITPKADAGQRQGIIYVCIRTLERRRTAGSATWTHLI